LVFWFNRRATTQKNLALSGLSGADWEEFKLEPERSQKMGQRVRFRHLLNFCGFLAIPWPDGPFNPDPHRQSSPLQLKLLGNPPIHNRGDQKL
jgi:hypothetical protein